ncbi:MAG: hypothetical protein KJ060_18905 [Candidatus Hydrogenedentes bacterium]|nr:hypothetical protein [Candidatus Hydrogenedentota bacterium]
MRRSSIFSSKTLESWPRLTAPAWGALAIFVAARLALLTEPDAFLTVAELESQHQYMTVEALHRLSDNPTPRVIVAGTSRFGALPTDCMAEHLGCAPEEIANYSRAGNTFWRVLAFFRRNPSAMENLDLLIIDLLPFQLYRGPIFGESDPLFISLTTREERARIASTATRAEAWVDDAIPYMTQRRRVMGWWDAFTRLAQGGTAPYLAFHETPLPAGQPDPWLERHDADLTSEMMNAYAPGTDQSAVQVGALAELRALLPERARIALVWPPVREDFLENLSHPGRGYYEMKTFLENNAPGCEVIWIESPSEWSLTEDDFVDVVHFTPGGFEKVCTHMGNALGRLVNSRMQ